VGEVDAFANDAQPQSVLRSGRDSWSVVLDDELQHPVGETRANSHRAPLSPTQRTVLDGVLEERLEQEFRERDSGRLRGDIPCKAE
jgi:hypothetical protein